MKILIGPIEIAGYYWQLTQGFRENGVRCDFVTLDEHPFGKPPDREKNNAGSNLKRARRFNSEPKFHTGDRIRCLAGNTIRKCVC